MDSILFFLSSIFDSLTERFIMLRFLFLSSRRWSSRPSLLIFDSDFHSFDSRIHSRWRIKIILMNNDNSYMSLQREIIYKTNARKTSKNLLQRLIQKRKFGWANFFFFLMILKWNFSSKTFCFFLPPTITLMKRFTYQSLPTTIIIVIIGASIERSKSKNAR